VVQEHTLFLVDIAAVQLTKCHRR